MRALTVLVTGFFVVVILGAALFLGPIIKQLVVGTYVTNQVQKGLGGVLERMDGDLPTTLPDFGNVSVEPSVGLERERRRARDFERRDLPRQEDRTGSKEQKYRMKHNVRLRRDREIMREVGPRRQEPRGRPRR